METYKEGEKIKTEKTELSEIDDNKIEEYTSGGLRLLAINVKKIFESEVDESEKIGRILRVFEEISKREFPDSVNCAEDLSNIDFFAIINSVLSNVIVDNSDAGLWCVLNLISTIESKSTVYAFFIYQYDIIMSLIQDFSTVPEEFHQRIVNILFNNFHDLDLEFLEKQIKDVSIHTEVISLFKYTKNPEVQATIAQMISLIFVRLRNGKITLSHITGFVRNTIAAIVEIFPELNIDTETPEQSSSILRDLIISIGSVFYIADFNAEEMGDLFGTVLSFLSENRRFSEEVDEKTQNCFTILISKNPDEGFVHAVAENFNFQEEFSNLTEFSSDRQCSIIRLFFAIINCEIPYKASNMTVTVEDFAALAESISSCNFRAIKEMIKCLAIIIASHTKEEDDFAPAPPELCNMVFASELVDKLFELFIVDDNENNNAIASIIYNLAFSLSKTGSHDLFFNHNNMADWITACEEVQNDQSQTVETLRKFLVDRD